MSGHRKWSETPEAVAAYEQAERELDAAWMVECRYGNCVVFVSPDSNVREDLGGWGPVGCPCEGSEDEDAAAYYQAHKDDEDEWGEPDGVWDSTNNRWITPPLTRDYPGAED